MCATCGCNYINLVKKKAFWDKKNPNKTSKKLTPTQIKSAKARAKAAGRPYPNDNI
jgi:hypothetical protein